MQACTDGGDIPVYNNRRPDLRTRQWAQRCTTAGRTSMIQVIGTVPPATRHAVVAGHLGLENGSFRADSTYRGYICPVGLLRGFMMCSPWIIRILGVETSWPAEDGQPTQKTRITKSTRLGHVIPPIRHILGRLMIPELIHGLRASQQRGRPRRKCEPGIMAEMPSATLRPDPLCMPHYGRFQLPDNRGSGPTPLRLQRLRAGQYHTGCNVRACSWS